MPLTGFCQCTNDPAHALIQGGIEILTVRLVLEALIPAGDMRVVEAAAEYLINGSSLCYRKVSGTQASVKFQRGREYKHRVAQRIKCHADDMRPSLGPAASSCTQSCWRPDLRMLE